VILILGAILFVFTSVPFLKENSWECCVSDTCCARPTSHLVSPWVYLGGDGGVFADGGYAWATCGGRLPC